MPLRDTLHLVFLFALTALMVLEVVRGLWAQRRRRRLQAEPALHETPALQFGAHLGTHALATLGTASYVFLTGYTLTQRTWLPVLLMASLVFGLLLTAWLRVVPAAVADTWTLRDRLWCRLVHALLWPLHIARGRRPQ